MHTYIIYVFTGGLYSLSLHRDIYKGFGAFLCLPGPNKNPFSISKYIEESFFNAMEALIHSFIHSGHFYSAPSSPLPLRGAPDYNTDTVSEFHAEAHRQLQVKDLPKVPA